MEGEERERVLGKYLRTQSNLINNMATGPALARASEWENSETRLLRVNREWLRKKAENGSK